MGYAFLKNIRSVRALRLLENCEKYLTFISDEGVSEKTGFTIPKLHNVDVIKVANAVVYLDEFSTDNEVKECLVETAVENIPLHHHYSYLAGRILMDIIYSQTKETYSGAVQLMQHKLD